MNVNSEQDIYKYILPEILLQILDLLSLKDLLKCCQVCWHWNCVANDNLLWYKRCITQNITAKLKFENESCFWKDRFLTHLRCCSKWRGANSVPPTIVSMHNYAVITDLVVHHNWAACSLDNGSIVVIDILANLKKDTFNLYEKGAIWALVAFTINNEDYLASGGSDGVVRIWNISTGNREAMLENEIIRSNVGDRSIMVRCLAVSESESCGDVVRLVSGGRHFLVLVWDVVNKKCVHVLQGHSGAIRCVKANKMKVVSASYDGKVIVWNIFSGEPVYVLDDHIDRVYSVYLSSKFIISSSIDTNMKVWDITTGECLHTLSGHSSMTKDIAMDEVESRIISGNADRSMKVWSADTGDCILTIDGAHSHLAALTSVQIVRETFIVSSSANGVVKLWNLHDGSFIRDILVLQHSGTSAIAWKIVATDTHLICATGSSTAAIPTKLYIFNFSLDPPFIVEMI